jgi:tetratricopeptide (TPR) repeat protein
VDCRLIEEEQIIERYIAKKLSEEDSEVFEQHYFSCEHCFEELKLRTELATVVGTLEPSSHVDQQESATAETTAGKWKWVLATAALLILLLIPVQMFLRNSDRQAAGVASLELPTQLLEVGEMPPYLSTTVRGATGSPLQLFRTAMEFYVEEDYEGAVSALEEAAAADPDHIPTVFYLGVSHLAVGQVERARNQLEKVIGTASEAYREEAHWYLAKAYFQLGETDLAGQQLEQVAKLKGPWAAEAEEHLRLFREHQKR